MKTKKPSKQLLSQRRFIAKGVCGYCKEHPPIVAAGRCKGCYKTLRQARIKRYHDDPEYRRKLLSASSAWAKAHPERMRLHAENYWRRKLGLKEIEL